MDKNIEVKRVRAKALIEVVFQKLKIGRKEVRTVAFLAPLPKKTCGTFYRKPDGGFLQRFNGKWVQEFAADEILVIE